MTVINIPLDADLAQIYEKSSAEDQQKVQALVGLWLREIAGSDSVSLNQLMDLISERAQKRGLTPQLLEELLNDE